MKTIARRVKDIHPSKNPYGEIMTIFILELLTYMHFTSYQVVVAFLLLEKILFSFASFCFVFLFIFYHI